MSCFWKFPFNIFILELCILTEIVAMEGVEKAHIQAITPC